MALEVDLDLRGLHRISLVGYHAMGAQGDSKPNRIAITRPNLRKPPVWRGYGCKLIGKAELAKWAEVDHWTEREKENVK